jgi:hypothetical protein
MEDIILPLINSYEMAVHCSIHSSHLNETLQLICIACIGTHQAVTREGLRGLANLWHIEQADVALGDLY